MTARCIALAAAPAVPSAAFADFEGEVRPLLEKYCFACHGEAEQKGRIRYDEISEFRLEDQTLWSMVYENLADREMPPDDELQPTAAELTGNSRVDPKRPP